MAQIEQRTTHIKILGCGLGGRVVDGDSGADQVDGWRVVGPSRAGFTILPQCGTGHPADPGTLGVQDYNPFPLAKGEYPRKTNPTNNEHKDDEGAFIGAREL